MTTPPTGRLRPAALEDGPQLSRLWALVFDEGDLAGREPWREHAADWFARSVGDPRTARFPVIDVDGQVVATAIGTLELGVPNPYCVRGRAVRLANVITLAEHRRQGYGATLIDDVLTWARSIGADRVDLSTTPDGRGLYEREGFVVTSAPRMKLVL